MTKLIEHPVFFYMVWHSIPNWKINLFLGVFLWDTHPIQDHFNLCPKDIKFVYKRGPTFHFNCTQSSQSFVLNALFSLIYRNKFHLLVWEKIKDDIHSDCGVQHFYCRKYHVRNNRLLLSGIIESAVLVFRCFLRRSFCFSFRRMFNKI